MRSSYRCNRTLRRSPRRRRRVSAPPRLRGGLPLRLALLLAGLFIFASGIVALLESGLGLSPWDVLHEGIAKHTPLSFGAVNVAVSVVVVALAWLLCAPIGIATLMNAILVGAFVDTLAAIEVFARVGDGGIAARVALLAAGIALMGAGTALYLGANLGAGPRDSLMVVGASRSGQRIGVVRTAIELAVLVVGALLGGTVGIGTLMFAIAIGPTVEIAFAVLARSPLAIRDTRAAVSEPSRAQTRRPACCVGELCLQEAQP